MVQRYEFDVLWGGYRDSNDARVVKENGRYVTYEDYAALEDERDELAADYAQQVDKVNELAARLRAVKDSLNHERNVDTTDDFRICRSALLDLVTALDGPVPECRDEHHTMSELYEHRHRLFIALMSRSDSAWWSHKHDDGSGYDGWIIAGMDTPEGMVTYHLPDSFVEDMPPGTACAFAPKWDGHTPGDVLDRLRALARHAAEGGDHE